MATASVDQGFGTTITFATGFAGSIRNVNLTGMQRDALDTTHMGSTSGWKTFLSSDIKDAGELSLEVLFDPSKDWVTTLGAVAASVVITFPVPAGGSTAGTITTSGFMTAFEIGDPYDDIMTATITVKFTGVPVFVAAT